MHPGRAIQRPMAARTGTGSWPSRWGHLRRAPSHWSARQHGRRDGHEHHDGAAPLATAEASSPTGSRPSSSVPTRPSRPRSATWWVSTSTRPTGPSCSASTRRPRSRHSTAPSRCCPCDPGQVERHTHDYKRHGTTCLFAALEVGTGRVTTDHRVRHTGADFLIFLKRIARAYPDQRAAHRARQRLVPTRHLTSGSGSSGTRASPSTSRPPARRG